MAPVAAPQRPLRSDPAPEVEARPDLRVVTEVDDAPARRSLGGIVGTISVVLLFVCIFGVVVFQVFLVQTQSHLDDLGETLSAQESRAKALDLQTADLESPERIVAAARDLGMIAPNDIVYLDPGEGDDAAATFDPATERVGTIAPGAVDPATGSSTDAGSTTPTTAISPTPANPSGGSTAPGPPYTAENNWGAGGPTTVPPVYSAENNWGAGPTASPPAGSR